MVNNTYNTNMFLLESILLSVLVYMQVAADCPKGWLTYGQSCYHVSHDTEPFTGAKTICADWGAYLVEIDDTMENDFLFTNTNHFNNKTRTTREHSPYVYYTLGLTDLLEEGVWAWYGSKTTPTYTNWSPGQPESEDDHNCVMMDTDGTWSIFGCRQPRNYICEMSQMANGNAALIG